MCSKLASFLVFCFGSFCCFCPSRISQKIQSSGRWLEKKILRRTRTGSNQQWFKVVRFFKKPPLFEDFISAKQSLFDWHPVNILGNHDFVWWGSMALYPQAKLNNRTVICPRTPTKTKSHYKEESAGSTRTRQPNEPLVEQGKRTVAADLPQEHGDREDNVHWHGYGLVLLGVLVVRRPQELVVSGYGMDGVDDQFKPNLDHPFPGQGESPILQGVVTHVQFDVQHVVPEHEAQQCDRWYADTGLDKQRRGIRLGVHIRHHKLRLHYHEDNPQQREPQGKVTDHLPPLEQFLPLGQAVPDIIVLPRAALLRSDYESSSVLRGIHGESSVSPHQGYPRILYDSAHRSAPNPRDLNHVTPASGFTSGWLEIEDDLHECLFWN